MEIAKSPWWRHLYSPKIHFATHNKLFIAVVWSVRGGATVLGGSHLVLTLLLYRPQLSTPSPSSSLKRQVILSFPFSIAFRQKNIFMFTGYSQLLALRLSTRFSFLKFFQTNFFFRLPGCFIWGHLKNIWV